MSFHPISSQLQTLEAFADKFAETVNVIRSHLEQGKYTLAEIEPAQNTAFTKYAQAIAELELLTQNSATLEPAFHQKITELKYACTIPLKRMNEVILTRFPLARIQFFSHPPLGTSLVGLRVSTKNPTLQAIGGDRRAIRGNGDCYFICMAVVFLEALDRDPQRIEHWITLLSDENIDKELQTALMQTAIDYQNPANRETILKDPYRISPFISCFRQLAGNELEENALLYEDFFSSTLQSDFPQQEEVISKMSYGRLVNYFARRLGIDATQTVIQALCRKLNFPIVIYDAPPPDVAEKDASLSSRATRFLEEQEPQGVLYRCSDHYEVIYPGSSNAEPSSSTEPLPFASSSTDPLPPVALPPPVLIPLKPSHTTRILVKCFARASDCLKVQINGYTYPLLKCNATTYYCDVPNAAGKEVFCQIVKNEKSTSAPFSLSLNSGTSEFKPIF